MLEYGIFLQKLEIGKVDIILSEVRLRGRPPRQSMLACQTSKTKFQSADYHHRHRHQQFSSNLLLAGFKMQAGWQPGWGPNKR